MRTGRPKATLKLNEDEKRALTSLAHRSGSAPALARRARMVLACAEGHDNQAVARAARHPGDGRQVAQAICADRLEGLYDEPRPGAPAGSAMNKSTRWWCARWKAHRAGPRIGVLARWPRPPGTVT
jgi:hypothetical protein